MEGSVSSYEPRWDLFTAEWVIGRDGLVAGDVGVCLSPRATDYARQAAPIAAVALRTAIAGVPFDVQRGFRHVIMRYGPHGRVEATVRPAAGPLALARSRIEQGCNPAGRRSGPG